MAKRKKKPLPPRAKRMKRAGRLQSAKHWVPKYSGKNVVRGYAKHYGVDHLCAVLELRMIGVEIDPVYVEQLKATAEAKAEATRRRKQKAREAEDLEQPWDTDFDDWPAFLV